MTDKKNGTKNGSTGGTAAAKDPAGGMTKMDAVKKAIEKLGPDAMPVAIKDHLKRQYGIEISADVASNYKMQLKAKAAGGPPATTSAALSAAPAAPVASPQTSAPASNGTKAAGDPQPAPAGRATKPPQADGKAAGQGKKPKVTKTEAVKRALAALGEEATRTEIQSHVRKKYGLEITLDHISNCKGELAKRASAEGTQTAAPAKKPAAPKPQAKSPAPAPGPAKGKNGAAGDVVRLDDVLLAKELLNRVGAGPLRTLLDGLAK